tara:strand:- start:977 stop:1105 length:129 start_codon:yes stop_codon:yes gene_type:complete
MKIKFDVEIDTETDRDIGYELVQLLKELVVRVEQVNQEFDDE